VDVVNQVNFNSGEKQKTGEEELGNLIAASSVLSSDSKVAGETEKVTPIAKFEDLEERRPDIVVETNEALSKMFLAIELLPLFDRKILRLKGIDLGP
jgi:hypothetical protein